jgi:alpha-glucosidase
MERLIAYYGDNLAGAHLPFNFQLIDAPWRAKAIGDLIEAYEAALPEGAWPNWVLSNHDRPRIAARVGEAQARVAAMLLLTLRGSPTLYYGDEIGIGEVEIPPERIRDPWALREPGIGVGRDPERTPMQWDDSAFAGFSAVEPWLPLTPDWRERNVAAMRADQASMLSLVRALLAARRVHKSLSRGRWRRLESSGDLLAYERTYDDEHMIVVLNFGAVPQLWPVPATPPKLTIALSSHGDRSGEAAPVALRLRANEGLVLDARKG